MGKYTPLENFILDILLGRIQRDTLPAHAEPYSDRREREDCERYLNYLNSDLGRSIFNALGQRN